MDSVNECSILECVEDNAGIMNFSAAENVEVTSPCNSGNNGSSVVESNDCETSEIVGENTGGSGTLYLPPMEIVPSLSPSSTMTGKGNGLKKWRRIKRDSNRVGDGSVQIKNIVAQDRLGLGLDVFAVLGHLGTDMENGEIWSSKSSSTAASSLNTRSETSAVVKFPPDEIRGFSGKKFTTSQGQQRKSWIVAPKKSGGEKVNIEKENSHSSVESDVRSSNFVSMQGTYSTSNGIQSKRSTDYNGDDGNEVQGIQQKVNNVLQDGEAGYKDYSPEHVSDDTSREINPDNGSSTDLDPLAKSIFNLESAKEALEKEVLKFREIRQYVLVTNPDLDLPTEFANDVQNPHETISEPSQSGEGVHRFSVAPQSEVLEIENRHVETDNEDLYMQKLKAEVEFLVISRAVQNLRFEIVDQISILEEQKTLASKQTQILNKLGDTEKKAVMLNKEAEKLVMSGEDIASADETLKLQNRVCKYATCFFVQLISLALIFLIFMLQLSPKYVDNVPT